MGLLHMQAPADPQPVLATRAKIPFQSLTSLFLEKQALQGWQTPSPRELVLGVNLLKARGDPEPRLKS